MPESDPLTNDKYAARCIIAGGAIYLFGWIAMYILALLQQFGLILPDPLGGPVYFSSVLPLLPAFLFCCGLTILVVRGICATLSLDDSKGATPAKPPRGRRLAIVAVVISCSIVVFVLWPGFIAACPASIAGVVCGRIAFRRCRVNPNLEGADLAFAALTVGYFGIVAQVIAVLFVVTPVWLRA